MQLDKTIVAPEGSLTIGVGASTDHDVIAAILENKPFPVNTSASMGSP